MNFGWRRYKFLSFIWISMFSIPFLMCCKHLLDIHFGRCFRKLTKILKKKFIPIYTFHFGRESNRIFLIGHLIYQWFCTNLKIYQNYAFNKISSPFDFQRYFGRGTSQCSLIGDLRSMPLLSEYVGGNVSSNHNMKSQNIEGESQKFEDFGGMPLIPMNATLEVPYF